jgi:ABC-2 type transport system ATP-binding protein
MNHERRGFRKNLCKKYGKQRVLDNISFEIPAGRIVGLIGPNGSGKTTTLKAILGLTPFDGEMQVLGLNPRSERDALMQEISFIADVAILPSWLTVRQAIDFVEGVHPKFNRAKAERFLAKTKLQPQQKVKSMSKGMVVQLHLALVMAIDAKLLVLDEPTLGLDILYRKQFYQDLLEDYFDQNKTIIITTHQVEEIEHVLSDVMFVQDGQIRLSSSMEELERRFIELIVRDEFVDRAQALQPIDQRKTFGQTTMLFDGVNREQLAQFGETRQPSVADLFVAMMKGESMKTMKFLLLREWWESRQLFIRTGLILIALSVVSAIISAIVMQDPGASRILPGAVLTAEQLSKEVDGIAGHSLAGRMFGFCVAMIFSCTRIFPEP